MCVHMCVRAHVCVCACVHSCMCSDTEWNSNDCVCRLPKPLKTAVKVCTNKDGDVDGSFGDTLCDVLQYGLETVEVHDYTVLVCKWRLAVYLEVSIYPYTYICVNVHVHF